MFPTSFCLPNAQVDGSQVVTIAAFDVYVLPSQEAREGVQENIKWQISPFPSSPVVVTAKATLTTENQRDTLPKI